MQYSGITTVSHRASCTMSPRDCALKFILVVYGVCSLVHACSVCHPCLSLTVSTQTRLGTPEDGGITRYTVPYNLFNCHPGSSFGGVQILSSIIHKTCLVFSIFNGGGILRAKSGLSFYQSPSYGKSEWCGDTCLKVIKDRIKSADIWGYSRSIAAICTTGNKLIQNMEKM